MRTLLLFDVDGVLVQPTGYKIALQDTVNFFATRMGQPAVDLSMEEIALFEACGLTNEWNSAALCVGALLVEVLRVCPQAFRDTFDDTIDMIMPLCQPVPRPDFSELAQEIAKRNTSFTSVTPIIHTVLQERLPPAFRHVLQPLFADIFALDTPTTRIQQTHTLGNERYFETYQLPTPFESPSYLLKYDTPLLRPVMRGKLLRWAEQSSNGFAIFTARPSHPPEGDTLDYAPEAELARELVKLPSDTPLIAAGRMQWIAAQRERMAADYIKPSPVQALASIGAALSKDEVASLKAAVALVEDGILQDPLARLKQGTTRIIVFEDSTGGIRAVRRAVEHLRRHQIDLRFEAVGVAVEDTKKAALTTVADRVVDDVNTGLIPILG